MGRQYYFNFAWTNDQPIVSEVGIFLLSTNHAVLIFLFDVASKPASMFLPHIHNNGAKL